MPKNDPIWPEIGIFVHFGPGLAGSFGWWLWRAGCISQDTFLLYVLIESVEKLNEPFLPLHTLIFEFTDDMHQDLLNY